MNDYVVLSDARKLRLLQAHSFQSPFPSLDHKNWCLHCGQEFDGRSVRVWRDLGGEAWLECGTPGCDGSPIDWFPFPWWDPKHPLTRKHQRGRRGRRSGERGFAM